MHSLTQDRPTVLLSAYLPARHPLCQPPHRRHRHYVPASIQVRNRLEALVESPRRKRPVHPVHFETMPMRSGGTAANGPGP